MIRAIARVLKSYIDFAKLHPVTGFIFSLLLAAGCAGAIYLMFANIRPWLILPCFTGACQ